MLFKISIAGLVGIMVLAADKVWRGWRWKLLISRWLVRAFKARALGSSPRRLTIFQ